MPLRYKIDILPALKDAGYSTFSIQRDKIFSNSTIQKFRKGEGISWDNLERVCRLLNMQPGDIIEYISEADSALNDK